MLRYAIALLALISTTAQSYGATAPDLQVENTVAQCVDIRLGEPVARKGSYFIDARFLTRQELSQCGCTSKVMSYAVEDERSKIIEYHRFIVGSEAAKTLKLGRVKVGPRQRKWVMRFGCTGPE